MRWTRLLLLFLLGTVWTSCATDRWVHPNKKEEQLTGDYNACERDIMNAMAKNPGAAGIYRNVNIDQDRIFNCLKQKGWRQIPIS